MRLDGVLNEIGEDHSEMEPRNRSYDRSGCLHRAFNWRGVLPFVANLLVCRRDGIAERQMSDWNQPAAAARTEIDDPAIVGASAGLGQRGIDAFGFVDQAERGVKKGGGEPANSAMQSKSRRTTPAVPAPANPEPAASLDPTEKPSEKPTDKSAGGGEVVRLDRFRKK